MIDDSAPTIQDATLVKFARAALTRQGDSDVTEAPDVPWEEFDLTDPQQRNFGDYELIELLGRGGMGVVYRARQKQLDRDVAIKFVASAHADNTFVVAKFLEEARAAAKLHHPNIVPVFEVGSVDCLHYFTMPLMRGKTLADLESGKPMEIPDVVALMRKLCSAVSYAHSLSMLHLDLKPANVMIDEHGEPLIGDFGLARQVDDTGSVTAQEVSGTPAFMAPEQIQIKEFRLTARTDIYALGAILFRLLTAESPHGRGGAQSLMQNAVAGRLLRLRSLNPRAPRDLAAICEHCLALQPRDRYHSAAALEQDLGLFLDDRPVNARNPSVLERLQRWYRKEPLSFGGMALAFLILGGGLFGMGRYYLQLQDAKALTSLSARSYAATLADLPEGQRIRELEEILFRIEHMSQESYGAPVRATFFLNLAQQLEGRNKTEAADFARHYGGYFLAVDELGEWASQLKRRGSPASLLAAYYLTSDSHFRDPRRALNSSDKDALISDLIQASWSEPTVLASAIRLCLASIRVCRTGEAHKRLAELSPHNVYALMMATIPNTILPQDDFDQAGPPIEKILNIWNSDDTTDWAFADLSVDAYRLMIEELRLVTTELDSSHPWPETVRADALEIVLNELLAPSHFWLGTYAWEVVDYCKNGVKRAEDSKTVTCRLMADLMWDDESDSALSGIALDIYRALEPSTGYLPEAANLGWDDYISSLGLSPRERPFERYPDVTLALNEGRENPFAKVPEIWALWQKRNMGCRDPLRGIDQRQQIRCEQLKGK